MIKIKTFQTKIKDTGWAALLARFKHLKGSYVSIGIHEDAGQYPGGEPTVVEVGFWNEFGTDKIPERSFIRSTIDGHEAEINQWRAELLKDIIAGKSTVQHALDTIGFRIRELIKNKIQSNVPPPYGTGKSGADSDEIAARQEAKRKKGVAPVTLVESTLLLRSIEYRSVVK